MRVAVFVALFCVVSLTAAETLKSARLRSHPIVDDDAEFLEMKKTPFGQNLMNMLSLKFHASNGKLQVVLDLLDQLKSKLNDEQKSDDSEYATELTRLQGIIKKAEDQITADKASIKKLTAELKTAESNLADDEAQLLKDQEEKKERIAQLEKDTEIRKKEHQSYEDRKAEQESMVSGIEVVVSILKDLLGNNEVAQNDLSDLFKELADLKETLKASLKSDQAAEDQAQANFESFKKLTEERIAFLTKEIKRLETEIAALKKKIAELKAEIAKLEEDIVANQKVIEQAEAAIKTLKSNYQRNTKTREEQLNLIKAVKARLTGNKTDVQKYLNNA